MGFLDRLLGRPEKPAPAKPQTPEEYFANPATWTSVVSSNVGEIAYWQDPKGVDSILAVYFWTSSSTYWYHGVPEWVFKQMLRAVSPGKFVHLVLVPTYFCEGPK